MLLNKRCRYQLPRILSGYAAVLTILVLLWKISLFGAKTKVKVHVNDVERFVTEPVKKKWSFNVVHDIHPVTKTEFFKPRLDVINPYSPKYIIQPKRVCNSNPFLIILVCSVHSHSNVRNAIRDTWASSAQGILWPGSDVKLRVKLMFLFGKVENPSMEYLLKQESKTYDDILLGSFQDNYKNLTTKVIMGLHYVAVECLFTEYILKADEDTFTNINSVYHFLQSEAPINSVIGHIYNTSHVRRFGKWQVSVDEYPFEEYPYYAAGNTYILSRDLVNCIINMSLHLPYVSIEDVFVTGIVAAVCHANLIDLAGFTYWLQTAPNLEDFIDGVKLSANKVSPGDAREIWAGLLEISENKEIPQRSL